MDDEAEANDTKKIEGADLANTAENKFLVPNIRSILQSDENFCKEQKKESSAEKTGVLPVSRIAKSAQLTPKNRTPARKNKATAQAMNASFVVPNGQYMNNKTRTCVTSVANESMADKAKLEQKSLLKLLKEVMKKKEAAEKEYVELSAKDDELTVTREKDAASILSQEKSLGEAIREKKILASKCQCNTFFQLALELKRKNFSTDGESE